MCIRICKRLGMIFIFILQSPRFRAQGPRGILNLQILASEFALIPCDYSQSSLKHDAMCEVTKQSPWGFEEDEDYDHETLKKQSVQNKRQFGFFMQPLIAWSETKSAMISQYQINRRGHELTDCCFVFRINSLYFTDFKV